MTDDALLLTVESTLPEMNQFDRAVYAHARLRVLHGQPLKPAQRQHLTRLVALVERLRAVAKEETRL